MPPCGTPTHTEHGLRIIIAGLLYLATWERGREKERDAHTQQRLTQPARLAPTSPAKICGFVTRALKQLGFRLLQAVVQQAKHPPLYWDKIKHQELFIFSCTETGNLQYARILALGQVWEVKDKEEEGKREGDRFLRDRI